VLMGTHSTRNFHPMRHRPVFISMTTPLTRGAAESTLMFMDSEGQRGNDAFGSPLVTVSKTPKAQPGPAKPTKGGDTGSVEILYGESKGVYRLHPACRLFPLLQGKAYEELKQSIKEYGQTERVVIDGEWFLDGRHRVRANNELGRETLVVQFADLKLDLSHAEFIISKNLPRRHLTDDQRLATAAKCQEFLKQHAPNRPNRRETRTGREDAEEPQQTEADEFRQKPAENSAKRKRGRPRGKRSEARAVATAAGQSRYRAEQMVQLCEEAPDLAEAVERGDIKLKEAVRQNEQRQKVASEDAQDAADGEPTDSTMTDAEQAIKEAVGSLRAIVQKLKLAAPEELGSCLRALMGAAMAELVELDRVDERQTSGKTEVVSFRLTATRHKQLEEMYKTAPVCHVKSEKGLARKIVCDFLAGRLTYPDHRDLLVDMDIHGK